jgi:hypothetical protein
MHSNDDVTTTTIEVYRFVASRRNEEFGDREMQIARQLTRDIENENLKQQSNDTK